MRLALVGAMALYCLGSSTLRAELIAHESFNYTEGDSLGGLNGGTGFSTAWSAPVAGTGTILVQDGLTYSGLLSNGGSVYLSPASSAVTSKRTLASTQSSGTLYASYLVNIDSGNRYFALTLVNTSNVNVLQFGKSTANNNWAIVNSNGSQTAITSSTSSIVEDTTFLLVLRIDFDASGTQDRLRLYVNPDLSAEPGTAQIDTLGTYDLGTISGISIQSAYTLTSNTTTFGSMDEIRLGSDYLSVVPEPGSARLAIGAGFVLGVCFWRQRRRLA